MIFLKKFLSRKKNYIFKPLFKGNLLIHYSAIFNQEEIMNFLISIGSPVNAKNEARKAPLAYSHYNKNFRMIKLLIKNLADPNQVKYSYGLNSDAILKKMDDFIQEAKRIWNDYDGLIRVMLIKKIVYLDEFVNL
jgi:ankyrin repeat protein